MRLCWYAFQGVACILSPYGAFTEKPPALPGDVYYAVCPLFAQVRTRITKNCPTG